MRCNQEKLILALTPVADRVVMTQVCPSSRSSSRAMYNTSVHKKPTSVHTQAPPRCSIKYCHNRMMAPGITVFMLSLMCFLNGCSSEPRIDVTVVSSGKSSVAIKISSTKINRLTYVDFLAEDGEQLWHITTENKTAEILYGHVPPGFTQSYPADGLPRGLKLGETVDIEIGYQCDVWPDGSVLPYRAMRQARFQMTFKKIGHPRN